MHKNDVFGMILLMILYLFQGILLTLFTSTLPLILSERGLTITELSWFNLCSYPFSLKIVFAPFLDKFFWKNFGQRKSYIIPVGYIVGVMCITASLLIDSWLGDSNVSAMSSLGFVLILLMAIQDIAIDAWAVKILEDLSLGPLSQSVGISIGFLCANSLYFNLEFTESIFLVSIGVIMVLITVIIHFFIPEIGFKQNAAEETKGIDENEEMELIANNNQNNSKKNLKINEDSLLSTLQGFYTNKHLRMLIFLAILQTVGVGPIMATFTFRIQKAGITKKLFSNVHLLIFPAKFIMPFIIAKFFKPSLRFGNKILLGQVFFQVFQLAFLYGQNQGIFEGNFEIQFILLVLTQFGDSFIISALIQLRSTLYGQIASSGHEGVYLTMLSSVQNLGRKITISSFQYFDGYLNFYGTTFAMWIFQIGYIFKSSSIYGELDSLSKSQWSLFEQKEKEKNH